MGAGYMHTGYYFGFFLAALANYVIGANFGWRWMFVLGGTPALLVGWIQSGVHESAGVEGEVRESRRASHGCATRSRRCSARAFPGATITMSLLFMVSIIGLWAGSIYVPTAVTQIALREGHTAAEAATASRHTAARSSRSAPSSAACWRPCSPKPSAARKAMALYFVLMLIGIGLGFGKVFYMANALMPFFMLIFFLGLGGANFALYTLWIPEQYTHRVPRQRDRLHQLGRPLRRRRDGVPRRRGHPAAMGSLGVPVAITAVAFIIGLLVLARRQGDEGARPLPVSERVDVPRLLLSIPSPRTDSTRRSSRTTAASSTASR